MRLRLRAALVSLAPVVSFLARALALGGVLWGIGTVPVARASSALVWGAGMRTEFGTQKLAPVARAVSRCLKMDPSGKIVFGMCAVEVPLQATALPKPVAAPTPSGAPDRAPANAAPAKAVRPGFPAQLRGVRP